jgi:Concanavalin A-like lectin/glucanases superfamily
MKRYYGLCLVALLGLGMALVVAPSAMAGAQYSSTILADSPIGYWRLGESQTTPVAADATGGGRDGTYTRSVVSGVAGAIGGDPDTAATFDGMTTSVDIPAIGTDPFNLKNGFTLEAWVINEGQGVLNPNRSPLGRIVSNGWPGNLGYGWGILTDNGMRFTTYGIFDYDSHQSQVPQDGAWHYVAVVFDSTNTANFYIDGTMTDSISASAPAKSAALDLMIGRNPASTAEEFFNGSIDEVAIYMVELQAADIARHYQAGK